MKEVPNLEGPDMIPMKEVPNLNLQGPDMIPTCALFEL